MIDTTSQKVKVNQVIFSQIPSFVQEENPLFVEFLKSYYQGQEYQGGSIDIIQNLNEYQKVETYSNNDSLIGFTTCSGAVTFYDSTINVVSTDGWPDTYGLLRINDEVISYTGKTKTSFTGCLRGFSGVENLHTPSNPEQLVFKDTNAAQHKDETQVINLSNLFLQEFWKKTKTLFLPGFEDRKLVNEVDKANFLRQAKDFYASKGTNEAVSILFKVLYGKDVEVIKPIDYLLAPSDADYVITEDIVAELISGDALKTIGQVIKQTGDDYSEASIFNIRYLPKNGKDYYVISLSKSTAKGEFSITGGTALTNNIGVGATVLTVDSTLGFPNIGDFYVGAGITVGIATYTSRSSTQFFGVSGISSAYQQGSTVRSSNTLVSYEEGDLKKPVIFRMTAVANNADLGNVGFLYPGDILRAKNLGNFTKSTNQRLNSWIHNVKTTSNVSKDIYTNTSNINVGTNEINTTDPHLLRLGDPITVMDLTSNTPQNVEGTVSQIVDNNTFQINITSGTLSVNRTYKVRNNTIFANSNDPKLGVSEFVANVQNTYSDDGEKNSYVASGSLPAYTIYATERIKAFTGANVGDNEITINNHGFFTGDLIKYRPTGVGRTTLVGLATDANYAVTKIDNNTVKLSQSIGDAAVKRFLDINSGSLPALTHELVPYELSGKSVEHQRFLRKIPTEVSLNEFNKELKNEPVGMFRNGVEVMSNRSGDYIRYGTVRTIEVQNGGKEYDVAYPPNINITDTVGTGATAYAIVENGKVERIDILSGGYDLRDVPKITIEGANGVGAAAVGRLRRVQTVRGFSPDLNVNLTTDTITLDDRHLFDNGESVYYRKGVGYAAIGGLVDNSLYYLHTPSETQVQFMATYDDAVSGINTINLTSKSAGSNTLTSTKFRNILDSVVITNQGSGYSNRRNVVNNTLYPPISYLSEGEVNSGINTANHYIYFKDHGFNHGDLIEYDSTGPISGLSTDQNYYVIKLDESKFRLSSAGIGTTLTDVNYVKDDYVEFGNIGSANHTFKYPDLHIGVEAISGVANTTYSTPKLRPVCLGELIQCPITSSGTGYGVTDCINVHRRPDVTISNGSRGLIDVVIADGEIVQAFIKSGGGGYATPPKLEVRGDGQFAKLVANTTDGVITSVTIVSTGKGYTSKNTTVAVIPSGSGAKLVGNVQKWDISFLAKYRGNISENDDGVIIPSQGDYGLKYVHAYASRKLRQVLDDNIENDFSEKSSVSHSPILGWAYDGSPIYGPYGFGTPTGGLVRRMISGYTKVTRSNRPPVLEFPTGTFINDYVYTATGDLDQYNGRFCKTPEFPNGIYAYFATIEATNSSDAPFVNTREPEFPYIIGGYKYKREDFNVDPSSIQTLDLLNSGDLVRNTYYYKFGSSSSEYDYLTRNQLEDTELIVRSTQKAGISTVNVIIPGQSYKVGDRITFNNLNSGGSGASAKVKTLVGKGLSTLTYERLVVPNVKFRYENDVVVGVATTAHNLNDKDLVVVGGIGTGELNFIQGAYKIGVSSVVVKTDEFLGYASTTGITTFVTLNTSGADETIEVDDILGIGTERVTVLDVNETTNKYRILRDFGIWPNSSHPAGTKVHVDQRRFTYDVGIKTDLTTRKNRKIVFDPFGSIGIGTTVQVVSVTGIGTTTRVVVKASDESVLFDHAIPPEGSSADNSITLLEHGFVTGQKLKYNKGSVGNGLTCSNSVALTGLLTLQDGQTVYAVRKSPNLLGITTTIAGIGTTTGSLYFAFGGSIGKDHSFTTTEKEYIGHIERFDVNAKTSSDHTLQTGNEVKISILPSQTTTTLIEYDTLARKTIVDPYYVGSATTFVGVGASDSLITITDHGWDAGDKVLYKSGSNVIAPLVDRGEYFVQKINDNQFRLTTNYTDATNYGGEFIGITTFGSGIHKFSRINPHLLGTRGSTIGFAVSDPTLTDLRLEFYEDENFVTRFEGVGISTELVRSGTPGQAGSLVNLKLTDNVPTPLYYKLVPTDLNSIDVNKRDAVPDQTVAAGSKIIINNSTFAGNFGIRTTSNTDFIYQVTKAPESSSYNTLGVTTFSYSTGSKDALGGVNEIDVTFAGLGYERNPGVSTITTTTGLNALLRLYDDNIGRAGLTEMIKIGYEYPSDKSIQPSVDIPTILTVSNNFTLSNVGVITAGRNYVSAPDLIVPDSSEVKLKAYLNGTSIGEVEVQRKGRGFNEVPNPPRIIPVNNTNGAGIVSTSSNGVTNFLTIAQPTNGWKPDGSDFPFKVGDNVYVEGVGTAQTQFSASKGGYNSDLYDYKLFEVVTTNPGNSQLTYSIAGLGTTGGTFDPDNSAGRVIRQQDLPTFTALLTPEPFFSGERVTYGANGKAFVLENAGYNPVTNTLRLRTPTADFALGQVIKGQLSGAEGTIRNIEKFSSFYKTSYFADRPKGWQRETGKPNNDFQKIEDNDYYQNFSYSVKSEVPIETWKPAVDSLIHPTGYKNFSDLVVPSVTTSGVGRSVDLRINESTPPGIANLSVSIDNEESFFTRKDFDEAGEETLTNGLSKFITLRNRKIAAFINVKSNKVDVIDDLSDQFTGIGTTTSALIVGLSSFRLTTNEGQITPFTKTFNPTGTISIGSSLINYNNHNFQTGERIKYDPGGAYGSNRLAINATNVVLGGVTTNFLPAELYAIKFNNNQFAVAGLATAAEQNSPLIFSSVGSGTSHSFDVNRPDDRVVIQVDGILQPPLFRRKVDVALAEAVGVGSTTIKVVGVTSITGNDLLNIGNEIVRITNVGFGSTNVLAVNRGVLGSVAAAHTVGAACTMRGGTFHIVKDVLHFVTPPYGTVGVTTFSGPGIGTNSTFQGRIFNRADPTTNFIFDDLSQDFTGVGKTFTLLQDNEDVTGIVTTILGPEVINQGIICINNIFQRPAFDYNMAERQDPGIGASIFFTGDDRESLPRGGKVNEYTIGFGTNYQPLVAAAATAIVNNDGSIQSVVVTGGGAGYRNGPIDIMVYNQTPTGAGIGSTAVLTATVGNAGIHTYNGGTSSNAVTIGSTAKNVTNATYDAITGELVMTIGSHTFTTSDTATIGANKLSFTCSVDDHQTSHTYPRATDPVSGVAIGIQAVSSTTITVNVGAVRGTVTGITTVSGGTGYSSPDPVFAKDIPVVSTAGTTITVNVNPSYPGSIYEHQYVSAATSAVYNGGNYVHTFKPASSSLSDAVFTGGDYNHKFVRVLGNAVNVQSGAESGNQKTPNNVSYVASTGVLTLEFGSAHGMSTSDTITLDANSIFMSCERDNYQSEHGYPRSTDPISGVTTAVTVTSSTAFTINVGSSPQVNHAITTSTYTPTDGNLVLNVGAGHPFTAPTSHTISTCSYNPHNGYMDFEITSHGFSAGEYIQIPGNALTFTCSMDGHATQHTYPRTGSRDTDRIGQGWLPIDQVGVNTFRVYVGAANETSVGVHTFVSSKANSVNITSGSESGNQKTPNAADYNPETGILELSFASNHGVSTGDTLTLDNSSLTFTCSKDNHATEHTYPRAAVDPIAGVGTVVTKTSDKSFNIFVGLAEPGSVGVHTFVSASAQIKRAKTVIGIKTDSLGFTCSQNNHGTVHTYPRPTGDPVHNRQIGVGATATETVTVFVGITTAESYQVDNADYDQFDGDLILSIGANNLTTPTAFCPTKSIYDPTSGIVTCTQVGHELQTGDKIKPGQGTLQFKCTYDVSDASYNPITGDLTLTVGAGHGLVAEVDSIRIPENALTFTCDYNGDGNTTQKTYPRSSGASTSDGADYAYNTDLLIKSVANTTITVNVNGGQGPITDLTTHNFVSGSTVNPAVVFGTKKYPRSSDPIRDPLNRHQGWMPVTRESKDEFSFWCGTSPNTSTHTFVANDFLTPTNANYNGASGLLTVETNVDHKLAEGDFVKFEKGAFTLSCEMNNNATTHDYPRKTDPTYFQWLPISNVGPKNFDVSVGTSPVGILTVSAATYNPSSGALVLTMNNHGLKVGQAIRLCANSLIFTCNYNGDGNTTEKTYPRATGAATTTGADYLYDTSISIGSTTTNTVTINANGGMGAITDTTGHVFVVNSKLTPTDADYNPNTGVVTITVNGHGMANGDYVKLDDSCLKFSCTYGAGGNGDYPRASDPISGQWVRVFGVTANTFDIQVLTADPSTTGNVPPSSNVDPHTFVSAVSNSITRGVVRTGGDYPHTFVNAVGTHIYVGGTSSNAITITAGSVQKDVTDATYIPSTGLLTMTIGTHSFTTSDTVTIGADKLAFTCDADNHATTHYYPRATDPVYNIASPIESVTSTTITVDVGSPKQQDGITKGIITKPTSVIRLADKSLTFKCSSDNFVTPQSYPRNGTQNPPIVTVGLGSGYSDLQYSGGSGSGFKASIQIGSGGSVTDFTVVDSGIGYKNDEVLTVVGVPTANGGYSAHTITVNSITNDLFSGWSFGQLLELDSFADQFDGNQTTFTLTRTTVTKDIVNIASNDTSIDVGNNLLVFLNDILQQPGSNYTFSGGTQLTFSEPPKAGSKLQVLFFRGSNKDVDDGSPFITIKKGDYLQLEENGVYEQQDPRRVIEITGVQKVQTNIYNGVGINADKTFTRQMAWTKQKQDLILDNLPLAKDRSNYIPRISPTAYIIQPVGVGSQEIFVDNAYPTFSAYDNRATPNEVPGAGIELVKANIVDRADATVSVSAGGTVFNAVVTDGGAGYQTVPTVSFAATIPRVREIGKNWSSRLSALDQDWRTVTRNGYGLFVIAGDSSGINTSSNGKQWYASGNSTTFGDIKGIVGMGTHTVLVGASGTCGFSTNGRTFSKSTVYRRRNVFPLVFWDDITLAGDMNALAYGDGIGVAVGAAGSIMFTKPGAAGFGTAFELAQKFSSTNLNGVGNNGNVFVAVGVNGEMLRSPNGENYVGVTTTTVSTTLNDVTYADGKWIAVGAAGTIIKSTDDGQNWAVVSAGGTFDLNKVGYANSVFVAVGQSGMVMNSVDGTNWYKKFIGVGTDFAGLAFGDNKFVAAGLSSAIYTSEFESVSAAGTATVSAAGTITSINIDDGGFGYDINAPVEVLVSVEPVIREVITSVNAEGDFGDVVSVATSAAGINTTSPMLIFELDSSSFLNQAGFGNISKSGIAAGDYFVVTNSTTGVACTSINLGNEIVGSGTTFLDNVYVVGQRDESTSGIVTVFCNVRSIAGIGTTTYSPRIGKYSWGRFYSFQRDRLSPQAFPAYTNNGSAGIDTNPTVVRIKPLAENYSDFDQTS